MRCRDYLQPVKATRYLYLYIAIYIGVKMSKVIVVSDTVYVELQKMKKDTSFSKMIEELIQGRGNKGDIGQLERLFGTLNKKNATSLKKEVNQSRRSFGKNRLN